MDERTERVSALLHEAGEVHHVVYRITDGADDDWASFYADWLTQHSELPDVLGGPPVRSHLVHGSSTASARMRTPRRPSAGRTGTRRASSTGSADGR
jgi:hypothetical protein